MRNGYRLITHLTKLMEIAIWHKRVPNYQAISILRFGTHFDDPEKLADMVRSVNQSAVSPEIKLSDNVYTYDFDNHQLVLADNGQTETAAAVMSM